MEIESKSVQVAGVATRVLSAGEGTPIVFLHGGEESAVDWQWVMPLLAGEFRVVAPDLPAKWGSTIPSESVTSHGFAEFLRHFLDALDLPRVVLAGNSFGGLVAMRFAFAHPDRVQAMILADSAGLGPEINPMVLFAALPGVGEWSMTQGTTFSSRTMRAWSRAVLQFAEPRRAPEQWLSEQRQLAARPTFLPSWLASLRASVGPLGQREVVLDDLARLAAPTLVVWGERDRMIPLSHARRAAKRVPNGRLAIIPNCGHLPHVECPEQFADEVRRFLREVRVA